MKLATSNNRPFILDGIIFWVMASVPDLLMGHSGDFGNAAKMVGKMSKLVMQLISIGF